LVYQVKPQAFVCGNLATKIASTGKRGYAISGTVSQRLNGHGRLAAAGSDETAAVAQEQILYVMGSVVRVDHRSFRIVAHAAGAQQVHRKLLLVDGSRPSIYRAGHSRKPTTTKLLDHV